MIRKMKLNKVALLFLTLVLLNAPAWSQTKNFKYRAGIQRVDSSGVYRIEISPDLIAKSKEDLSDIRIADNTNRFIAYALSNKILLNYQEHYIVFPEVTTSQITDTITTYIAENKDLLAINKLWIKLKKTEVNRTVNLTGSDNLKDWFAIDENILLESAGQSSGTDYEQILNFPNSNYRYFQIQVNGKNKTPVKILQAGINTAGINQPVFTALPGGEFLKKDSGKISHLSIKFDQPYQINKIHLAITSPKYYNRRVIIYDIEENEANQLMDTTINSGGSQNLLLSAKTRQLRIDIFNLDDNDLTVKSVTAFQLKEYLVSYLEKGKAYQIYTGNASLNKPSYDLSFLNNIAFNQLAGVSQLAVDKNSSYLISGKLVVKDHTLLLWSSIIIALILLSILTLKMVKEIKQSV